MTPSALHLIPEFTFDAKLSAPVDFGSTAQGTRLYIEVLGGRAEGDRLNGTVLRGGGDWLTVTSDGWGLTDVRLGIETDDGASLLVTYSGLIEINAAFGAVLGGEGATDFGDQYFRSAVRIATGDERYAWVDHALFVSEGKAHWLAGEPGPSVTYNVHRVG
ncbi:DUF3237 domain-containing protein [Gordonia sp. NPDC003376]